MPCTWVNWVCAISHAPTCSVGVINKMDELLQDFQSSVSVTFDLNDPNRPHPRLSEFKFKREGYGDQESRRRKLIEEQKSRRRDYVDYARMIAEGDIDLCSDEDEMEEGGVDEVDGCTSKNAPTVRKKSTIPYKNQLMLSEWLVDVPVDFEDKWYMVICPVAKRCLIISHNGKTYAYSRSGRFFKQFSSTLPGGSKHQSYSKTNYCILDCLFHEGQQTFFVLDIMCWGGHPVYDSDTEFRFFWLHSRLSDLGDEVIVQSRINPYKFIPLQYHSCSTVVLQQVLQIPLPIEIDGLLFFHKEAHYFRGRSPIVLWLKPHMVHNILRISVSDKFLECVPVVANVVSMDTDKQMQKGKNRSKKSNAMDTTVSDGNNTDMANDMTN